MIMPDRGSDPGVCLSDDRLLRPPQLGRFLRSFPLHSPRYARETIAEIGSIWVALATAIITQADSTLRHRQQPRR